MSAHKIPPSASLSKSNGQISAAIVGELTRSAGPGHGLGCYTRRMPKRGQEIVVPLWPNESGWRAVKRLQACGTFPKGRTELIFPGGETWSLGRHRCTHRMCPTCGRRRGARLAEEMARSLEHLEQAWGFGPQHLRFATLTIPNVRNVAEGLEWIAQAWHRALATKTWGRLVAGGFRCWEVKPGKDGKWNVHLHAVLVLWNGRVPYQQLRGIWDQAAGAHYNVRFDELRGIRAREGRTKGAAVAAYISKYLVKVEDLEGAAGAPGGLPHLAAALEGRRLFGAFGAGAVARRWVKARRPRWMEQVTKAMFGHRDSGGESPIAAFHEREDQLFPVWPLPAPEWPKYLEPDLLDTHPGFTPEDRALTWESVGPKRLALFPWRKVPKTLEEADARAAIARELRGLALGCRDEERAAVFRRLAAAIAPPRAFRWGKWWKDTRPERKATWVLASLLPAVVPTVTTPHGEPLGEYIDKEVDKASTEGRTNARRRLAREKKRLNLTPQGHPGWVQPPLLEVPHGQTATFDEFQRKYPSGLPDHWAGVRRRMGDP